MNKTRRAELSKAESLLNEAKELIESVQSEEQDSYDNLPESLQNGDKGQAMSEAIDNLEQAASCIDDAITSINDASN